MHQMEDKRKRNIREQVTSHLIPGLTKPNIGEAIGTALLFRDTINRQYELQEA